MSVLPMADIKNYMSKKNATYGKIAPTYRKCVDFLREMV